MPTLNDIDNTIRRCDSKLVRQSCAFQRGLNDTLSHETWARYRAIAGIPKGARSLTDREAFLVLTVADMFRSGWSAPTNAIAAHTAVLVAAEKRLTASPQSMDALRQITASKVKGSDLPRVLSQMTGRPVSERTLYRWGKCDRLLPRYSRTAEYNAEQLRRWVAALS